MSKVVINLSLSSEQYLSYYTEAIKNVIVKATNGQTIQFPANILKPFVSHTGINGVFELVFDKNNKFLKITKI